MHAPVSRQRSGASDTSLKLLWSPMAAIHFRGACGTRWLDFNLVRFLSHRKSHHVTRTRCVHGVTGVCGVVVCVVVCVWCGVVWCGVVGGVAHTQLCCDVQYFGVALSAGATCHDWGCRHDWPCPGIGWFRGGTAHPSRCAHRLAVRRTWSLLACTTCDGQPRLRWMSASLHAGAAVWCLLAVLASSGAAQR